jgi:LL-diaminopimelate aminotransferase
MPKVNPNILKLKKDYFFNEIEKKILLKQKSHKDAHILNLGIGDISLPLPVSAINAMKTATDELKSTKTLKGYGPSEGYLFLKEKILFNDYKNLNIDLDEIFISNGAKYTTGCVGDLFSEDNTIGICDPAYPVYVDSNIISGRIDNIVYLPLLKENNFEPQIPKKNLDIIYLCSPNNPIGNALSKENLKLWVEYAKKNKSLIFFDGAYEAFITSKNTCKSIYEIDGAKDVAIEMRSFSKTAGFTSLRCGYIIIPKQIEIQNISINYLWNRYINTKMGGISYPVQKGAEAIYSEKGKQEVKQIIETYQTNTKLLLNGLKDLNFEVFGGVDSPYVWCKSINNLTSMNFFETLLEKNIATIPGNGFGKYGEGYVRFSGFAQKETIEKALGLLKNL